MEVEESMMMRNKILTLVVLALAAASLPVMAATVAAPKPAYTRNGFNPRMLDASAPRVERMKLFAHIIALANHGQVRAQDLAGTMYWKGPEIAGSPVPVNLVQARKLLANAAVHGDQVAMAKLAELELAAGRTKRAMIWAQLYARYLHPIEGPRSAKYDGFSAQLIARIEKAGGKTDQATRTGVATMVTRFDKSIRKGIDTFDHLQNHGRTFLVRPAGADRRDSPKLHKMSGIAEYMVGFDSHGKPVGVWPLDAFPDPQLGAEMRHYLNNIYANAVDSDSGVRYLRISITHQPYKFRYLRLTH
jgi:hypothetical protein